ncbi:MAG: hypothetical protein RL326_694 [Pseudomonadota bacterium]|jgi:hypothetical protein
MTDRDDSALTTGTSPRVTPGPRDRQVLQLLVLALLLIAVGVVIGRLFRSVTKGAYRPERFEVNLNLA